MNDEGYMTRLEAAAMLRASDQTVDRRIREGAIAAIHVGRRVLIPRESLEQFMDRCRAEAVARRQAAQARNKEATE